MKHTDSQRVVSGDTVRLADGWHRVTHAYSTREGRRVYVEGRRGILTLPRRVLVDNTPEVNDNPEPTETFWREF